MSVVTNHVYYRIIGSAIALLLHSGNAVTMFLALRGDILKDPDIATLKATQFKYMTVWNIAFQLIYSFISLICDIPIVLDVKQMSGYIDYLRRYRKVFFGGVIFPTAMFIFSVFWPFFICNRELIFPSFVDKAISLISNHIMHTAILPIAMWELFNQPRTKPRSHKVYLAHTVTVISLYLVMLFTNYAEGGSWPYPMFTMLYGTIYFPLVLFALIVFYISMYFIQWPLTSLIFEPREKVEKIK